MPDSRIPTFEEAANNALALDACRFHPDTVRDRRRVLAKYVFPCIGTVPVSELAWQPVVDVLLEIWREKPAQARKVKSGICSVVDWAIVSGYRTDPLNVHLLTSVLGPQPKPRRDRALAHSEVGSALAAVRECSASPASRLALEFLILTASRSDEVRSVRWDHIDVERGDWNVSQWRHKWMIPPCRSISTHAHRVLDKARGLSSGNGFVFPDRSNRALSRHSLSGVLRALGIDATPHSFRTSFMQWCSDTGVFKWEALLVLGHVEPTSLISNVRPRLPQTVRQIMQDWADFVCSVPSSR